EPARRVRGETIWTFWRSQTRNTVARGVISRWVQNDGRTEYRGQRSARFPTTWHDAVQTMSSPGGRSYAEIACNAAQGCRPVAGAYHGGRRSRLPEQTGTPHHPVPARRQQRRGRAIDRHASGRAAPQGGGGGGPARGRG